MPVVMVECEPIVIFDGSQGKSFELTLSENVVLQTANMVPGEQYIFTFIQDSVGGYTVLFPATVINYTTVDAGAGIGTKQIFDCGSTGTLKALAAATVA